MTYFVENYSIYGQRYCGTVNAKKPKEALKKYFLYYNLDNKTIEYCKRFPRFAGCDFSLLCTETGRKSYFIVM